MNTWSDNRGRIARRKRAYNRIIQRRVRTNNEQLDILDQRQAHAFRERSRIILGDLDTTPEGETPRTAV